MTSWLQGWQLSRIERVTHAIWPVDMLTHQGHHFTCNFINSHSKPHFSHTNWRQIDSNIFPYYYYYKEWVKITKSPRNWQIFKKKSISGAFFFPLLYFPSSDQEHGKQIGNSAAKSQARDFEKVCSSVIDNLAINFLVKISHSAWVLELTVTGADSNFLRLLLILITALMTH